MICLILMRRCNNESPPWVGYSLYLGEGHMRLREMQEYARRLSSKHGWDEEPLEVRLKYMRSEFKEVLDEVEAYQQADSEEAKEQIKRKLGYELHDLIWNISDLANRFGIDLEESCWEKRQINENRVFSDKPKEVLLDGNFS